MDKLGYGEFRLGNPEKKLVRAKVYARKRIGVSDLRCGDLVRLASGFTVMVADGSSSKIAVFEDGTSCRLDADHINPTEILGECVFALYV